jgi:pyrimidine-nucleoside phosphorylase
MLARRRRKKEDKIDHAVGLEFHKRIGDRVEKGESLATIHYNSDAKLAEASSLIFASDHVGESAPRDKRPFIHRILRA